MNPLVSIGVPIYNVESYIERCARSLFEQTYVHIEYIFIDDNSPDDSIGILKATPLEQEVYYAAATRTYSYIKTMLVRQQ